MKNVVKCYKDFFPYFKALKTNCASVQNKLAMVRLDFPYLLTTDFDGPDYIQD